MSADGSPAAPPAADEIRDAVRLLLDADAAVLEARRAWLAAGDAWASARATYDLASRAAAARLGADPVTVKLGGDRLATVRRVGALCSLTLSRVLSRSAA